MNIKNIPANINKEQLKTIGLDKPEFSFNCFIEGLNEESKTTMIELNNNENSYISLLPIEIINNVLFQYFYGYHILSKKPDILKKELDTIITINKGMILIVSNNGYLAFGTVVKETLSEHPSHNDDSKININSDATISITIGNRIFIHQLNDIDIYEMNYIKND